MLYDLTTRVQFLYLLGFGYNGKYKDRLEKLLHQGADMTLKMQSAAYELPYGGRSSQYLFNEALVCSVSEYEAAYYKKEGDLVKRCV